MKEPSSLSALFPLCDVKNGRKLLAFVVIKIQLRDCGLLWHPEFPYNGANLLLLLEFQVK